MTGSNDLNENVPDLPLRNEFGIFCFGWIGAIIIVSILSLIRLDGNDAAFDVFLRESMDTVFVMLWTGLGLFVGGMLVGPWLVEILAGSNWYWKTYAVFGVGLLLLVVLSTISRFS